MKTKARRAHSASPPVLKSAIMVTGLILLMACTTTKTIYEWRAPSGTKTRFGHLMVVALFQKDDTRRMFEDEFAWQISNMGPMSTRSYNVLPVLNESTSANIANVARAIAADGVLVIRMHDNLQNAPAMESAGTDPTISLSGYLQFSWKNNCDPAPSKTNVAAIIESKVFDAKTGKLVWSLATESKNEFGWKWEVNLLAKRVLARFKAATRAKE